jgi:hypothetical protein
MLALFFLVLLSSNKLMLITRLVALVVAREHQILMMWTLMNMILNCTWKVMTVLISSMMEKNMFCMPGSCLSNRNFLIRSSSVE